MAYGIIFDLDGTLADTMDDLKTAINGMLSILGYESRTKFELINFINRGARELVRRSLPTAVQSEDFLIDSALNIYEQEYEKCYCDKTVLYPGIKEAVEELKAKKFKVGVLSNKQDVFVKTIIAKLFGEDTFDFVMGKTNLPHKPDPSSALVVAKEMKVKPHKCIFIGDSDVDMLTAQNADMRSIGVSWGYRKPELLTKNGANYIAEKPEDLVEHATELVRIIKLEKKQNRHRRRKITPVSITTDPLEDTSLNVQIKPIVDPSQEKSDTKAPMTITLNTQLKPENQKEQKPTDKKVEDKKTAVPVAEQKPTDVKSEEKKISVPVAEQKPTDVKAEDKKAATPKAEKKPVGTPKATDQN